MGSRWAGMAPELGSRLARCGLRTPPQNYPSKPLCPRSWAACIFGVVGMARAWAADAGPVRSALGPLLFPWRSQIRGQGALRIDQSPARQPVGQWGNGGLAGVPP